MSGHKHLTDEELIAYCGGELAGGPFERADARLSECPSCQKRWAEFDETFRRLAEVKMEEPAAEFFEKLGAGILEAVEKEAAAHGPAAPGGRSSAGRMRRLVLRNGWAAVAAAAIMFALLWPGFGDNGSGAGKQGLYKSLEQPAISLELYDDAGVYRTSSAGWGFSDLSEEELAALAESFGAKAGALGVPEAEDVALDDLLPSNRESLFGELAGLSEAEAEALNEEIGSYQ